MVLVYPIGVPLFYAWKLYAARQYLNPGVGQNKLVNTNCVRYVKSEKLGDDGERISVEWGYVVENTEVEGDNKPAGSLKEAMVKHKDQGGEVIRLDVEAAELSISLRSEIEQTNPNVKGLSFLYSSYEPRCWWFEVFVTS